MTIEARRHSPRVNLRETAYVNFGSGNRGVILDVSEGGLRFKTAAPLPNDAGIRFALPLSDRTEGTAQLAWTDESRTIGGLRFTTVPPEIRNQIRDWTERGDSSDPLRAATAKGLREEEIAAALSAVSSDPAVASSEDPSAAGNEGAASDAKFAARPWFSRPPLLSQASAATMFPSESMPASGKTAMAGVTFTAPQPRHHRLAIAFLLLLIVLGAATAAAEYYYPAEARRYMSQVQSKVERFINPAGKGNSSEAENASMAGVTRFEGSFEPGKPGNDQPPVPSSPPPSASQPDLPQAATAPAPDATASKNSAETDMQLAQTYLSHGNNPDEKAKAVQLLWLATEKGNIDAEMQLADLYSRGDGVVKSCVQAHILLKAAAAANAAAAQPKLDALDQSGCS